MSENISPTEVMRFVMKVTPKLLDVIGKLIEHNRTLEEKFEQLDQKVDQIFLREIRSSFQTIFGIAMISSKGMRERHLLAAEENLLKNIALDPALKTAGEPNSAWNARSLFGLSCIAALRGEAQDATRFLLRAFVADPREGRTMLAPDLFRTVFDPRCADLRKKTKAARKCLPEAQRRAKELREEIWEQRAKELGGGIAGIALLSLFPGAGGPVTAAAHGAYQLLQEKIKGLKAELAALPTPESIQEEYEREVDGRCRELAQSLLNQEGWEAIPPEVQEAALSLASR